MDIKFLGTGGAFDFAKGNAAAIVTVGGKNILIDCGFSTILKLGETGVAPDVDYILLTHLHGDHIGGLPTLLAYYQYVLKRPVPPIIVTTQQFQSEIHTLLTATHEAKQAQYISISDFPDIGYVDSTGQHMENMTSFAYYFTEENQLIYYSGDIANAQTAKDFLDSRTEKTIRVFHETTPYLGVAVHTPYTEVQEKLKTYDVYAYHIAKENMPADCTLKYVEDYPELLF